MRASPLTTPAAATPTAAAVLEGWGMSCRGRCEVARPRSAAEVAAVLAAARERGATVGLRGSGCSYGDAALNTGGIVLDASAMDRVLDFDPATGVVRAEPGVTIKQLWELGLPHGYWPPVVPGTMLPTLGGCAAMNVHGKNNFKVGTIGDHVLAFDLMLADGSVRSCRRDRDGELFHAAIGGFGMLGCFTELTLRLKKVSSGLLRVQPLAARSVHEMIALFEERYADSDYLVGWVDGYGRGAEVGRGLIHQAWYLAAGEDDYPARHLLPGQQALPARFFGVLPRSWTWLGLWCLLNPPGMRAVNAAKYHLGRRHARHPPYRQSLVAFSFLLDYVPRWKHAYKPGGLIQYQSFVPKDAAAGVFAEILTRAQDAGIHPYLGVLKKHRPDPFLMTHAVDGYSLALDFPVSKGSRARLWRLAAALDPVVTGSGGRFYFAKDSTMTPATLRAAYPADRVARFLELKHALDPGGTFQTDLFRRLFA